MKLKRFNYSGENAALLTKDMATTWSEHIRIFSVEQEKRGVPNSIRTLIDDAEDIKKTLEIAAANLKKLI